MAKRKHYVRAVNIRGGNGWVTIQWDADIGFGEYTIRVTDEGRWKGDSECMDRGEDKSFLESIFESIINQIEVK